MGKKRMVAVLLAAGMLFGAAACSQEMAHGLDNAKAAQVDPGDGKGAGQQDGGGSDPQEGGLAGSGQGFHAAADYLEIIALLQKIKGSHGMVGGIYYTMDLATNGTGVEVGSDEIQGAETMVEEPGGGLSDTGDAPDYSGTNVQVEGIAESDIVKTDGNYIYILSGRSAGPVKVSILRIQDGAMEMASSFTLKENAQGCYSEEMYVSGDKLVIVRQGFVDEPEQARGAREMFHYWREAETQILVYDIADRTAPALAAEHCQDGYLVSSREKDGYLYVLSEKGQRYYWIMEDAIQFTEKDGTTDDELEENISDNAAKLTKQEEANLPKADGCLLPASSVYLCEDGQSTTYTIITSICLDEPGAVADSISIMTDSSDCYVSGNAIYLTADLWHWEEEKETNETNLVKIGYTNGEFELLAQGSVKGRIDDQFSMDEKDGFLRLVTTVNHYQTEQEKDYTWQRYLGMSNALYVLDGNLQVVGALEDLAENEMIYSARFIGDTAYFVTYRNTDPLFSVDLSDPADPKLLGELKIPGFSDYLHPYGSHLLLGIGYDAGDTKAATNFIKLSMFDITDPSNVVEKHTLVLDGYSFSEACYNHKSVLVDAKKDLIGLSAVGYGYLDANKNWAGSVSSLIGAGMTERKAYLVFGYDEKDGFYQRFEQVYTNGWTKEGVLTGFDWDTWYDTKLRGLYVGDYFYLVNSVLEAISYKMGVDGFTKDGLASLN